MGPHDLLTQELEDVSDALRDFYHRAHRLTDRMMTARGASYARLRMLMQISRAATLRSTDLAASLGYAPRTVTEAIDGLERDGLVRRVADPEDRRAKRISLTPAGEDAARNSEASRQQFLQEVFGALDVDERSDVIRLVGKLNQRLADLGG